MSWIPGIKQISQVGNDMYAQGAIPVSIGTTEASYIADPADTRLLAGRDPVIESVPVGMSGKETDLKYSTGAQPLTVTDAMQGNLRYLNVEYSPYQDLHGYDSPWPAGGGENILDPNIKFTTQTVRGVTLTTTDGYNFSVTGTGESGAGNLQTNTISLVDCVVYPAGTYTVTGIIIGTYHTDGSWYSNRGGTFTSSEDFVIRNGYREIATGTTYNINDFISMAKGDTAPTVWSPYSNLCPISGTTDVNVYVAPAYDPAATPEATVSLGSERYGGTAEIVSGTGSDGFASEIITKDSAWYGFSTGTGNSSAVVQLANYQNVKFVDGVASYNGALGSVGPELQNYWVNARQNETCADMGFAYSATGQLRIHRSDVTNITDLDSFKAALPDIQIVYPLATPTPYTFPGAPDITLQDGSNTIWTDTNGTDISVTYVTEK